ncbi:MAG TPA: hypothetical protein VFU15_03330, partial [Bacteroidia bacterium]|nr:hypothetical protein [Bacteroidia bacterium]
SSTDRRKSSVTVTPLGKKMLAQCSAGAEKFRKNAGKGISQEELNHLKATLDRLYGNCGGAQ